MKKNLLFKILVLLSALILSFSFIACKNNDDGKDSADGGKGDKDKNQYNPEDFRYYPSTENKALETSEFSIWSSYTTDKIKRDDDRETKFREVYIEGACGETEGGQLIMTPKRDVNNYELSVSDLKCGSNSLSAKEDIEVFVQYYINVENGSAPQKGKEPSAPYGAGWYPDALIPYDKIIDKGENNVKAGNNQGFWFDVIIPEGTAAGLYEGKITLTADDDKFEIPLKVRVFDFSIGKAVHAKTAFGIWRCMLPSVYGDDCDADEIYDAYYEYLLKYKITGDWMPGARAPLAGEVATKANETVCVSPGEFAKVAYKYASREEVNCFEVPGSSADAARPYLKALAEVVINEKENKVDFIIFDKAFLYTYDEPTKGAFDSVKKTTNEIRDMKRELASELSRTYKNVEGIDELMDALVGMDVLVTQNIQSGLMTEYDGEEVGGIETWCPLYDRYGKGGDNGSYYYESYKANERGESTWWYGCCTPQYPYVNYFIDNSNVGMRVQNWQMKDFDIEGNLYWCINVFMKWIGKNGPDETNGYVDRDVWNDPNSFPGDNNQVSGDGYLVYPGNRYDLGNDPIPTIRLAAIRDGQEDYEYLWKLEQLINEANEIFGSAITMEEVMGDIYDSLYKGVIAIDNTELVFKARREVAGMIEALSGKLKAMATIFADPSANGSTRVNVYAPEGASVNVNGVAANYKNGAYVANLKLDKNEDNIIEIVVEKGGDKTILYRTAKIGGTLIDNLENNKWSRDEMAVESISALDGNGVMFIAEHGDKKTLNSYLDIKNGDFSEYDNIEFYAYNPDENVIKVDFMIVDENNNEIKSSAVLRTERWTKVKIAVPHEGVFKSANVKELKIEIKNPDEDETVSVIIDNIIGIAL